MRLAVSGADWILTLGDGRRMIFTENPANINEIIRVNRIEFPGGYSQTINYSEADGVKRMTSVVDSYGRRLDFEIDPVSRNIAKVFFGGRQVVQFDYEDAFKDATYSSLVPEPIDLRRFIVRVKNVTYPQSPGERWSYLYDDSRHHNALTGKTDGRNVRVLTVVYDANRRVTATRRAGGLYEHTFAYAPASRTITNPLGKKEVINLAFSAAGKPKIGSTQGLASANCAASNTTFEWDTNDFVSKETDAEGRITTYTNDPVTGLPTRIVRGVGTASAVTTDVVWNAIWRQPARVIEPGLTTDLTWDAAGKLTAVRQTDTTTQTVPYSTAGRTRTWTYGYDAQARLISVDGPLAGTGDTVRYTYNAQGFIQTMTNEVGHVTTVTAWNFRGQPTSVTDPNGVVSAYSYDGMGRLTSLAINPGANEKKWTLTYTLAGDLATFREPMGALYTLNWDNARRLMAIQNNLGERIEYTRDAMGNITRQIVKGSDGVAAFDEKRFVDELGRLIRQSSYDPMTWKFAYDRTDRLSSVTDPRTKIISYGYDAVGRAIRETERDGGVVTLTYNGKDEITGYQDPKNLTTSYVRNGFGEVIQETSPDRGRTIYEHDARGLVTRITDARNVVTNMTYDNAGRLLTRTYPADTTLNVTLTYDNVANGNRGRGRLTGMTDKSGTTAYIYDEQGHLIRETKTVGTLTTDVTYNYTGPGFLWDITYPSGRQVRFGYDDLGRRNYVDIKRSATVAEEPVVLSANRLPYGGIRGITFANGLSLWKNYDLEYRLTGSVLTNTATGTSAWENWPWYGTDGMNLMGLGDGIVLSPTQTIYTNNSFTYDDIGRLTSGTGLYGTRSYSYDRVGNRLTEARTPAGGGTAVTQNYTYTANTNRLASITQGGTTVRSFVYDAAGHMTRDTRGTTQHNYTISAAGRIARVAIGTSVRADYIYDGLSRLASRVTQNQVGAGTVRYVHDNENRIIAELNATGTTLREYVWLEDIPVAVLDGSTNTANPSLFFVHADHLNRPVAMSNAARSWVWRAQYEPFGAVHSIVGPAANDNRFPGQMFQLEAGLAYNWHRHYDATLGRYTQPDPLGLQTLLSDGPSVYGYANAVPTAIIDPTGLSGVRPPIRPRVGPNRPQIPQPVENLIQPPRNPQPAPPLAGTQMGAPGFTPIRQTNACQGGVYVYVGQNGSVQYVGRTNDFSRREAEHRRDPRFRDLNFDPRYPTNNRFEQRGIEQQVYQQNNPH